MDDFVPPPPRPPPLLAPDALQQLCTHGYLGLDLPPDLAAAYDRLRAAADAFFAAPPDSKLAYRPGVGALGPLTSAHNTERGYTHLAGEKEYLTLRRSMTHLPPGLHAAAAPVWHDTAHLLHRILADIAGALGLDPAVWQPVVADSLVPGDGSYDASDPKNTRRVAHHPRDDPPTLLRLFRYELGGAGAEQHNDLGLLTLCVCWGRGLQVKGAAEAPAEADAAGAQPPDAPPDAPSSPSPVWIDAPRVTVMTGNTLHVLTARRIPSASHRVVVDPAVDTDAGTDHARRSIVFALRATTAGDIDLAGFGLAGSVPARALYNDIRRQRINVNADRATRESMRQAQADAAAEANEGIGSRNVGMGTVSSGTVGDDGRSTATHPLDASIDDYADTDEGHVAGIA